MNELDIERIIETSKDIRDPASAAIYLDIEVEKAERALEVLREARERQRKIAFRESEA